VGAHSYVVCRIGSKWKFCKKDPMDANKIEKHYLLCFCLTEYRNNNTKFIITRFIFNLFIHCLMQKNMMNFV